MHNVKGNMLTTEQMQNICKLDASGVMPREVAKQTNLPLIVVLQVLIDNEQIETQDLFGGDNDKLN